MAKMARGQSIVFAIAVVIGVAMCIALALGEFSPKPEVVKSAPIPEIELQTPAQVFPTNEVVIHSVATISRVSQFDPATIHDPPKAGDRFLIFSIRHLRFPNSPKISSPFGYKVVGRNRARRERVPCISELKALRTER